MNLARTFFGVLQLRPSSLATSLAHVGPFSYSPTTSVSRLSAQAYFATSPNAARNEIDHPVGRLWNSASRRDRSQAKANGRDRWAAYVMAHHGDLRRRRLQ